MRVNCIFFKRQKIYIYIIKVIEVSYDKFMVVLLLISLLVNSFDQKSLPSLYPQQKKHPPWKINGWNLKITHLERKMIWTKPPWGHVPAVNLPGVDVLLSLSGDSTQCTFQTSGSSGWLLGLGTRNHWEKLGNDKSPIVWYSYLWITYSTDRIHGTGIFTYIYYKNQPFM